MADFVLGCDPTDTDTPRPPRAPAAPRVSPPRTLSAPATSTPSVPTLPTPPPIRPRDDVSQRIQFHPVVRGAARAQQQCHMKTRTNTPCLNAVPMRPGRRRASREGSGAKAGGSVAAARHVRMKPFSPTVLTRQRRSGFRKSCRGFGSGRRENSSGCPISWRSHFMRGCCARVQP